MANPQIRSFTITPAIVAPGGSAVGVVDAFDPDDRTVMVRAQVGDATAVTQLTVADVPVPAPEFTEVDAAGQPVVSPTLDLVVDPADPFRVVVTVRVL